jgi:hypothetical protein
MQRSRRATAAIAAIILAAGLPGCVSARDTNAVARAQAQALDRLAVESVITSAALDAATGAISAIAVERAADRAQASIITTLISVAGEADHAALDAMIAGPQAPANPLAAQVRDGRMSADDAHSWLDTYAAALRDAGGTATRRRLLEALGPVIAARSEAAVLSTALRERARANARLFADARASASALVGASESDPSIDALLGAAYTQGIGALLDHIEDPDQRAAAQRLLAAIGDLTDTTNTGDNR